MGSRLWVCPKCKTTQDPDDITTIEIIEPGRNSRVEFHGRIRPIFFEGVFLYSCLVCGQSWAGPPEDPTPGGASVSFLHPITECDDGCFVGAFDRDAC